MVISLLAHSCVQANFENVEDEKEIKEDGKLNIPDGFSWKTTQNVDISVTASFADVLYIKSADETVFYKQYLSAGSQEKLSITLPSYISSVNVSLGEMSKSISINGVPQDVTFN